MPCAQVGYVRSWEAATEEFWVENGSEAPLVYVLKSELPPELHVVYW